MKDQTHVDTTNQPASELTHISLCAGYGGIDLGLHRVFGQKLRTIAFSEIEAFAVENLLAKMEAGLLPAAPVWTDLRTFPWADFQGVDLLSGGFPCQPFSAAGKRNADSDPRHLFPAIIEGIRHAKPGLVFLENVEGIVSAKLAGDDWRDPAGTPVLLHVLRELERVGYKATAGIFSASEVGAPHQRKRVFILAHRHGERGQLPDWWREPAEQVPVGYGEAWGVAWPSRPGEPQHAWEPPRVVDTSSSRQQAQRDESVSKWQEGFAGEPSGCGAEAMGNAEQFLLPATREHGAMDEASGIPTDRKGSEPAQTDPESSATRKREGHGCNASECSETQSALGRNLDGPAGGMDYAELCISCDNRTDELRLLGNGVVPATAERAFVTLMQELTK
jgi:DNA (cytosine-5)-methyltransferase 1